MRRFLKTFVKAQSGAVTVDWVVLTAAVVGLALLFVGALHDSSVSTLDTLGAKMIATFGGG